MKLYRFNEFNLLLEAEHNLIINVPKDIRNLYKIFKKNGKDLYIVGGAVRDALLGKKPKDFDLATNAKPTEVIDILQSSGYPIIGEVGQSFGVVMVKIPSTKDPVEIATFRKDIGSGRRPTSVEFTTIDDDVKRRDLTINALFYDIGKSKIVDLVGGVNDIKNGIIRTVGDPNLRFEEDPLRKLRALRFAARTGSSLDKHTMESIQSNNSLDGVSYERIRDEFKKSIESAKYPIAYLELVSELALWPKMFPGISINQNFINTNTWILQIATLFGKNPPVTIKTALNKLTFTFDEINSILFLNELLGFSPDNVFDLHKRRVNTKLKDSDIMEFSKINNLNIKHIKAFLKYKPTTDGNDVIKTFNVKGGDIANKIRELEAEKFKNTIG